jgi:hypothetical protein
MGELDLEFELALRDRTLAHRAGSPDPRSAPHPIRCPRGQLAILDNFSSLFAQQRFVTHLPGLRSHGADENADAVCITGGESGQDSRGHDGCAVNPDDPLGGDVKVSRFPHARSRDRGMGDHE